MIKKQRMANAGFPWRLVAPVATFVVLNVLSLRASPIVYEGWGQVGDVSGWINTMPDGVSLGNSANYLSISFPAQIVPLPGQDDIIRTGPGAAAGFSGNYTIAGIQSVEFRFLASDYQPESLSLYFASSSHVWFLSLNTPAPGVWSSYLASLAFSAGWTGGPGADQAAFASDLTMVDWIGISIGRNYGGCDLPPDQSYGLDDFTLRTETPEPETYILLLAVLGSLSVVFRRELSQWWTTLAASNR